MTTATSIVDQPASPTIMASNTKLLWGVSLAGPIVFATPWFLLGSPQMPPFGMTAGVLTQLLLVSFFTDLSFRKIPNWATYTAFTWGLTINLLGYLMPEQQSWLGSVGLGQSFAGGFGLLGIMFVIFSISGGGAGDVKLSACLGALLGWDLALNAMLYSFVVAGAGMLCIAIWNQGPWALTTLLLRSVGSWLLPTVVLPPEPQQRALLKQKFPLAPFFAAGTLLALYWNGGY
ncbi:Type IV leader peptidase family protein [Rosistilla carotiformis]|uniref:Type IV leader peptidase family protein n=1 Tax=Rosistilla carotiformis TaxID=2528017 RepID=A0A518JLP4_9BACT|nr:A24 family peptidase [Rosistilla carotiformis]QDV66475.1 Type IV leader peptidase family protein [Rosistilla carotiformis]